MKISLVLLFEMYLFILHTKLHELNYLNKLNKLIFSITLLHNSLYYKKYSNNNLYRNDIVLLYIRIR